MHVNQDSNKYSSFNWQALPQLIIEHTITNEDIDALGHVNNQRYLEWMLILANTHAQSVGLGLDYLKEIDKVMVAKQHQMDFQASCFEKETLILGTWIGKKIGCCQRERYYQFIRLQDKKTVFSGLSHWACMSLTSYKPCRLPDEFIQAYTN